jgi:hypothetical protein
VNDFDFERSSSLLLEFEIFYSTVPWHPISGKERERTFLTPSLSLSKPIQYQLKKLRWNKMAPEHSVEKHLSG